MMPWGLRNAIFKMHVRNVEKNKQKRKQKKSADGRETERAHTSKLVRFSEHPNAT